MKGAERTIRIHTLNFGEISIPEDKVLSFREGIPGFPQIRRFALLEFEEYKPFNYLQSLDDPPIALLVVNPFLVLPEYRFELSAQDMQELNTRATESVSIYAVATIPEKPEEATINLMAPILINEVDRCGKQVIMHESGYSVKQPLLRGESGESGRREPGE